MLIPRGESGLLLRIERDARGYRLVSGADAEPEARGLGVRELGEWLEKHGAGTLIEIRRSFR